MLACMDRTGSWSYMSSESLVITRETTSYVWDQYIVRWKKDWGWRLLRCEIDNTSTVSED